MMNNKDYDDITSELEKWDIGLGLDWFVKMKLGIMLQFMLN